MPHHEIPKMFGTVRLVCALLRCAFDTGAILLSERQVPVKDTGTRCNRCSSCLPSCLLAHDTLLCPPRALLTGALLTGAFGDEVRCAARAWQVWAWLQNGMSPSFVTMCSVPWRIWLATTQRIELQQHPPLPLMRLGRILGPTAPIDVGVGNRC